MVGVNMERKSRNEALVEQGRALAATGVTRAFGPEEIENLLRMDLSGESHRLNQGALEWSPDGRTWQSAAPGSNMERFNGAITDFILERIAAERVPLRKSDLVEQGRAIAATGITRTFPPAEIDRLVGCDACGQFHRLNQGELEYRGEDMEWQVIDPFAGSDDISVTSDAFKTIDHITRAITDYIHERVAIEGEPAMIPEPEASEVEDIPFPSLRKAQRQAPEKTMFELKPATKRSDWDRCEDGNLQPLVFNDQLLHDLLPIVGPMAEALARRLKAEEAVGSVPPPEDVAALQAYQKLVTERLIAAESLIASTEALRRR